MNLILTSDTREIELTRGYKAIVDACDWEHLSKHKWRATSITNRNKKVYAIREVVIKGKRTSLLMHRDIVGITDPKIGVDHRNGDGLINTRSNLRVATTQMNCANIPKKSGVASSDHKGVAWHKLTGKWAASIRYNRKPIHIGLFIRELDAAQAYNGVAMSLFGEFAVLNVIDL